MKSIKGGGILTAIGKAARKCLDCTRLQASGMHWESTLCACTSFSLGAGRCHSRSCLPTLAREHENAAATCTLQPQQSRRTVLHCSLPPVLARQQESTTLEFAPLCQQNRWKVQRWHLLAPPSLGSISAVPCPSSRCFYVSK